MYPKLIFEKFGNMSGMEKADRDPSSEDAQKITAILKSIKNAEGIPIPYGLARRIAVVYGELEEHLKTIEVENNARKYQ